MREAGEDVLAAAHASLALAGGVDLDGDVDGASGLPFEYDPAALKRLFARRPLTALKRVYQVTSVGGGVFLNLALDTLLKRAERDPELEVRRARELKDIVTSLGPFFIKLGQALSI